jgi:hypothetical protein
MTTTGSVEEFFLDADMLDFDFDLPDFDEHDIQTALISHSSSSGGDDGT